MDIHQSQIISVYRSSRSRLGINYKFISVSYVNVTTITSSNGYTEYLINIIRLLVMHGRVVFEEVYICVVCTQQGWTKRRFFRKSF